MSIKVEIPKEIKEYKTKPFLNMSVRQLICFFSAIVLAVPTFLLLTITFKINAFIVSFVIVCEALPFAALGFIKKNKLPFEQYFKLKMRSLYGQNVIPYMTKIYVEEMNYDGKSGEKSRSLNSEYEYYKRKYVTTAVSKKQEKATINTARREIKKAKKECQKARKERKINTRHHWI